MKTNNHNWQIPIDKLMYWRADGWVKYENKSWNACLRIHCDQLIIVSHDKVLESLNMNGRMKGIYKEDVLILIVCSGAQEIRKFRFQIKQNAAQHLQRLGQHFPVVNHHSKSSPSDMRYRRVEEVFKTVLENYDKTAATNLPANYNDFIKLCLLDPAFPQVVHDTQRIFHSEILKKN